MEDPAGRPASTPPSSGSRPRPGDFALRYRGRDLALKKSEVLIGRSSECDVVFDSTLVSRRHARITVHDTVMLEDLSSRNGVRVNSRTITGQVRIRVGDVISFGDESVELVAIAWPDQVTQSQLRSAPTSSEIASVSSQLENEQTRRATALELLAGVVDKALALGHGEEAERLLQLHLLRLLEQAENRLEVAPDSCVMAAEYAVKLAAVTNKAAWLDYPIKLYSALGKALPLPVIDELYALLRKLSGIDLPLLRAYLAALRQQAAELGPAERFALQRIEGLERLASL